MALGYHTMNQRAQILLKISRRIGANISDDPKSLAKFAYLEMEGFKSEFMGWDIADFGNEELCREINNQLKQMAREHPFEVQ